jgi:hypothetical protein
VTGDAILAHVVVGRSVRTAGTAAQLLRSGEQFFGRLGEYANGTRTSPPLQEWKVSSMRATFLAGRTPPGTTVKEVIRPCIGHYIQWLAARPGEPTARFTPATLSHAVHSGPDLMVL